jgi:DNA-binding MarR family transcriptional regulator
MAKIDAAKVWSLNYRLLMTVINAVAPEVSELGLEMKELFVLAEVDEHPYPAELADQLCMPKPTVTVHVKSLEAKNLVRREIDATDLRRHRLFITPTGRKVLTQGLASLSAAFGTRLSKLTAAQQAELKTLLEKMT